MKLSNVIPINKFENKYIFNNRVIETDKDQVYLD